MHGHHEDDGGAARPAEHARKNHDLRSARRSSTDGDGNPALLNPLGDPDKAGSPAAILTDTELQESKFSAGSVVCEGRLDNSADGRGKSIWRADNQNTASVFLLVYDPAGRPPLASPATQQIGWFRPSGSVETAATRVSNNVDRLAEAIVLNYLALHDEAGRLAEVLPDHGLGASAAEIDRLVAFQAIRT